VLGKKLIGSSNLAYGRCGKTRRKGESLLEEKRQRFSCMDRKVERTTTGCLPEKKKHSAVWCSCRRGKNATRVV